MKEFVLNRKDYNVKVLSETLAEMVPECWPTTNDPFSGIVAHGHITHDGNSIYVSVPDKFASGVQEAINVYDPHRKTAHQRRAEKRGRAMDKLRALGLTDEDLEVLHIAR